MLTISRDNLLQMAAQYGMPLYIYDAEVISHQIHTLRDAFAPHIPSIHFACKALTTIGVLQHINQQGCGIDAVSPGEMEIALRAGVPPHQISFTPNGVKFDEYSFALQHGIHIHVDQLEALQWVIEHHPNASITLRFNPAVQAGGHEKLEVGASGSKFGIPAEQVSEVVKLTTDSSIQVKGVHMHLGSDIDTTSSFDEAYDYLLQLAMHWKDTLQHIDVGGGFKVPYHPDDSSIDIASFGKAVAQKFSAFISQLGRPVRLVLEPGKFLVSQAGYLLMEVSAVREAGDTDMIYVNSGFNHFIRPMNYGAYHHLIQLSNPDGEVSAYDVVGNLCETDTFALNRPLPATQRGDILCLCNAGAYGITMASNYNSRMRPAEVLWKDNTAKLIRRAETIEDLIRTDLGA